MEKTLRILYTAILIQVLLLIIVGIGLKMSEEIIMLDFTTILLDIVIGLITALVGTVVTTVCMWFAFLRKIPQKTEEKVDKLLNERLNHETTNHNTVMMALSPSNSDLSREHKDLLQTTSAMREKLQYRLELLYHEYHDEKVLAESRRMLLTAEQQRIKEHVEALLDFEKTMEAIQQELIMTREQNQELKETVRKLSSELSDLQESKEEYDEPSL